MDRNKVTIIGIYKYKKIQHQIFFKNFARKADRGLGPKCVPQLFLGSLLRTRFFFRNHSNGPRSLCESLRCLVSLSLLKWQKTRGKSLPNPA